jgi:peptidase E
MPEKQIVALGGGGFLMEPENPALDDYILSLVKKERPRVCFIPTASGDADRYIVGFYSAFTTSRCEPTHLGLFERTRSELRDFVLGQDIVYVGGGNTANMLAVWRVHDLDAILREAWNAGVVLAGVSAGAVCWFEATVTDSFGQSMAKLRDGLGLLPGSMCPHYDGEPQRRPAFHRMVGQGLPAGIGVDDGVALHFIGADLKRAVSSRPDGNAYRVGRKNGEVTESRIDTVYLGLPSES